MKSPEVESLPSALSWLREAWTSLPVPPARIHERSYKLTHASRRKGCLCLFCTTEDGHENQGAPQFSNPMWRILAGGPTDTEVVEETVTCYHPRGNANDPMACPDCRGDGVYQKSSHRYLSPMSAALHRLAKSPRPSDGTPAPVDYIRALAEHRWDVGRAALALRLVAVRIAATRRADQALLEALLAAGFRAGPNERDAVLAGLMDRGHDVKATRR